MLMLLQAYGGSSMWKRYGCCWQCVSLTPIVNPSKWQQASTFPNPLLAKERPQSCLQPAVPRHPGGFRQV